MMALCKDQSLTYLNNLGYNVVRLPRTGINPLDVIGKDKGEFMRLGSLDQIWASDVGIPKPSDPQDAVQISGTRTENIKLSFGLKILGNVLSALGVTVPGLEASYQQAHTLQFKFGNVSLVYIDPFVINNYLEKGTLKGGPMIDRYFDEEEDTRTFLLTETLLADTITVTAHDQSGNKIAVNVNAIKNEVEGKVDLSVSGENNTEISYIGKQKLVFGFKAFEIIWKDRWVLEGVGKETLFLKENVKIEPVIFTPSMRVLIRELE
jgi:hypothetical protein